MLPLVRKLVPTDSPSQLSFLFAKCTVTEYGHIHPHDRRREMGIPNAKNQREVVLKSPRVLEQKRFQRNPAY